MQQRKARRSAAAEHSAAQAVASGLEGEIFASLEPLSRFTRVAIAVSGGSDSVALMHLVHRWWVARGSDAEACRISILTVDHGLREAAAAEAKYVSAWSAALGFEHHVLHWLEQKPSSGLQAAARDARYELLAAWCRSHDAGLLLVGHTCDDQAETVLMRLAHGSGVDGLAGMAAWRDLGGVMVYRPLLTTRRRDLRYLLKRDGIGYIDDPSNEDEHFERVRVRKALASQAWGCVDARQIARSADRMRDAADALDQVTDQLVSRHCSLHLGGFVAIELAPLAQAPREIRRRSIERAIKVVGGLSYPPRAEIVGELCERIAQAEAVENTLGGCRIVSRKGRLIIAREFGRMAESCPRVVDGMVWDGRLSVRLAAGEAEATLGAIGAGDWPRLRRIAGPARIIPAFIGRTLPAVRRHDEIIAVPYLGYGHGGLLELDFVSRALAMAQKVEKLGQDGF